jgi:hypothetical protein
MKFVRAARIISLCKSQPRDAIQINRGIWTEMSGNADGNCSVHGIPQYRFGH